MQMYGIFHYIISIVALINSVNKTTNTEIHIRLISVCSRGFASSQHSFCPSA